MASRNDNSAPPARAGSTARDIAFQGLPSDPHGHLQKTLFPEDAYEGQTYWADLPPAQRTKWIIQQQSSEMQRELKAIWRMFVEDPLLPAGKYSVNYMVAGLGFLAEGYVLFSVGNILPLFESVWPTCFREHQVCNKTTVHAINYVSLVLRDLHNVLT